MLPVLFAKPTKHWEHEWTDTLHCLSRTAEQQPEYQQRSMPLVLKRMPYASADWAEELFRVAVPDDLMIVPEVTRYESVQVFHKLAGDCDKMSCVSRGVSSW